MPTVHRIAFGLETCMFSPHQMHGERALHLAAIGAMEILSQRQMSLQWMIKQHALGLVVLGTTIEYEGKLTFFSAPSIVSDTRVSLRDDGRVMLFRVRHSVAGEGGIAITMKARPVRLSGGAALDATPAPIDGELRGRFEDDEIEPEIASRVLAARIDGWTREAEPIGRGTQPLFIGRTDCELADQWQFIRLPSLVAAAREQLALGGEKELAVGLKRPIRSFHAEYLRPMYFGDRGCIELEAFRHDDRVIFTYRILGAHVPGAVDETRPLCAIAAEIF